MFGLKTSTINQINAVFAHYDAVQEVVLYGSRAKGNYKRGSDIDLILKGEGLNLQLLNRIDFELDDLLLPYTFDLSIYDQIDNTDLIEHIGRVGMTFYKQRHRSPA